MSSLMKILLVIRCTYNRTYHTAPNNPVLDLITVGYERSVGEKPRFVTVGYAAVINFAFLAVNRNRGF